MSLLDMIRQICLPNLALCLLSNLYQLLATVFFSLNYSYYRMRTERIEWYTGRDPLAPEIAELLDLGVFLPLKRKDEQNRQVIVIRVAVHDPKKHDQNDVFKTGKMILDYLIHQDHTISVYGTRAIFDMHGVSLGHAKQMPPKLIKRYLFKLVCDDG
jgi:hypothetical protein